MRGVYQEHGKGSFKTRITLPDGRERTMGCGSTDRTIAEGMAGLVAFLTAIERVDILEAILDEEVNLPRLFDRARAHFNSKDWLNPPPPGVVSPELIALMAEFADSAARVYAIRNRGNGCIKIGWAIDPKKRIKELATAHSERLDLLGSVRGGRALEKALHYHFGDHRTNGEWFNPHPDIIAWVEQCLEK